MKFKRCVKWFGIALAAAILLCLVSAGAGWWLLRGSLAQLDGRHPLAGLQGPVMVERDGLGVPTLRATNRVDIARTLGFLHAQDRFFQMDLSRRSGAGELGELFGTLVLDQDRAQRIHRPRARAQRAVASATPEEGKLLRAYAEGVNAGLAALAVRPPEYLALRTAPAPWQIEDTFLVAYAMIHELHETDGYNDLRAAMLAKSFSPAAQAFFDTPDTLWSAALDGSSLPPPPIPTPADFAVPRHADADTAQARPADPLAEAGEPDPEPYAFLGSNNWAVDGRRSATGGAIVANDMHLGLRVPNTWYRVRLRYHDPELGEQDVTGVTLPGTPVVVSGSNRHVAWANTASCLDIADLVCLEFDPANPRRYRTPGGWRELETFTETIRVRRGTNVVVPIDETIWGPVVSRGGARYALACTLHDPQAVNMGLVRIELARDAAAALREASRTGTPVNNFIVGDRAGNIGYGLLGRLPNRVGFDGRFPCSWADGTKGWQGWVPAENYPCLLNPPQGILWTANNRTLGTAQYTALHLCSPDDGARARQIRDALLGQEKATEASLWPIYADDRALFLERWQNLILAVLAAGSSTNAAWQEAQRYVAAWGARAAVDSQGYRLVRAFREVTLRLLFEPVNQHLGRFNAGFRLHPESAAWALLEARPPHLLNPKFASYDGLLAQAVRELLADLARRKLPLGQATWGARNRLGMRHPLSLAVPPLSRWLDMLEVPVSGDYHMPKVHGAGFGVSERMIVAPGHEENGLYNMPGGQSGHCLSPYYRSELPAWLAVRPQPFLPGPAQHRLELTP